MKLSRVNGLLIVFLAATALALSGCDTQAKRAMQAVDQKIKPMGAKKTEMGLFVVDPANAGRAYLGATITWNFADAAGQPQKEYLGFAMKRDGEAWQIEKLGLKYTDDKNKAIAILNGGKP